MDTLVRVLQEVVPRVDEADEVDQEFLIIAADKVSVEAWDVP